MRYRRLAAVLGVALFLSVGSCARDDGARHTWYDGSAPSGERQSIQDYQEVVEARMGEYVTIVKANSGPTVVRVPSIIVSCRGGYEMTTAIVAFEMPVDGEWAKALAKEMFAEVGLTTITPAAVRILPTMPPALEDMVRVAAGVYS